MTDIHSHHVILTLGSNTNDARLHLENALRKMEGLITMTFSTPCLTTQAEGNAKGTYLNQMLRGTTPLTLEGLTAALKAIEISEGRDETCRKTGQVPLDIDIMQYDSQQLHQRDWQREYIRKLISKL